VNSLPLTSGGRHDEFGDRCSRCWLDCRRGGSPSTAGQGHQLPKAQPCGWAFGCDSSLGLYDCRGRSLGGRSCGVPDESGTSTSIVVKEAHLVSAPNSKTAGRVDPVVGLRFVGVHRWETPVGRIHSGPRYLNRGTVWPATSTGSGPWGLRGEVPRRGPVVRLVPALSDLARPRAGRRAPRGALPGVDQPVLEERLQSRLRRKMAGQAEGEPVTNCEQEDRP